MQSDQAKRLDKLNNADLRTSAKKALLQLLEPLAGFVLDSGLSTNELNALFREAAVRSAAARQLEISNRINISGIAATTGIPRADISRILKISIKDAAINGDKQQQSTNRILTAWHEDPRFTGPNGYPAELKMYGRGSTFDMLAKRYGLGIPTRAVLDELIRAGAVELTSNQRIRAKASVAVDRGMSTRIIKTFGDRASELLSTMLINMRKPETPKFIANISDSSISIRQLPLIRKELSLRGADFLANIQESLKQNPVTNRSSRTKQGMARVSVTIFYHESHEGRVKRKLANKRRNFRRET